MVRHAESVPPGPGFEDEFTRPLSPNGLEQAERLADELAEWSPAQLVSSPYRRAIQTLEPYAKRAGRAIAIEPEFREHRMAPTSLTNWREVLRRQWQDFSFALEGGESMAESQARGLAVVTRLAQEPGVCAIAGHGTTMSLVLHAVTGAFGFTEHLAMPNPAIYALELVQGRLVLLESAAIPSKATRSPGG